MPYSQQDRRHPHLQLVAEDRSPDRRRRPAPPTAPPPRGGRAAFAQILTDKLTNLEGELQQAALQSPGIQPHLVFRIPLAKGAVVDEIAKSLRTVGLITVSIEPDRAVIAFRDDSDLAEFKAAVAAYRRGPRINPKTGEPFKSTKWDLFEYIETDSMKLWARSDRIGFRLKATAGDDGRDLEGTTLYNVDAELWHKGTTNLALASVQEVEAILRESGTPNNRIIDRYVGDTLCLLRIRATGATLSRILDLQVIAEVDFPPQPAFDPIAAASVTARSYPDMPRPDPNGTKIVHSRQRYRVKPSLDCEQCGAFGRCDVLNDSGSR